MDHSKALGTAPVFSLLLKYGIPAVFAMLIQVLYTIVDSIFIGQFVGNDGFAAITLIFPFIVLGSGCGMLVGVGACSYISLLLGQRKLNEAEKTLGNAVCMILIFSLITPLILLVFATWLVHSSSISPRVHEMASTFLWISIPCGVLPSLMFGLNNIIRVQGNPNIAMSNIIFGFLINAIFNPIFIAVFHWGVAGSALATVLAHTLTTIWILFFLTSPFSLLKIRWKNFWLQWSICGPVLAIGLAPFVAQVAASLQGMVLNIALKSFGGEMALTVSGVIYRVALVVFTVVLGIYQGVQPILGYNYGARQFHRVFAAWRLAIGLATVWCIGSVSLVLLFPVQTIALVSNEMTPEFISMSAPALRISLAMCILMGFQVIVSMYFQTTGKPRLSIFLSLTRQVLFMIPAILILPRIFPYFGLPALTGVWCSYPVADLLAFLLSSFFFYHESAQLKSGNIQSSILPEVPISTIESQPSITP